MFKKIPEVDKFEVSLRFQGIRECQEELERLKEKTDAASLARCRKIRVRLAGLHQAVKNLLGQKGGEKMEILKLSKNDATRLSEATDTVLRTADEDDPRFFPEPYMELREMAKMANASPRKRVTPEDL
ncbi:hypothetical protein M1403_01565 [Patescibacteria group bacterium]|nr:hypothetical protein [Patescibacteria group bacterium]